MGLFDRFKRAVSRVDAAPAVPTSDPSPDPASAELVDEDYPRDSDGWYVPRDGDRTRFVGADGLPPLRLIEYRDLSGERVLRLCEDGTGLLVGPSDVRLPRAGVFVSQLRGEAYHQDACRAGDFRPGQPVRLVREPANPYDANAVALYDASGRHMAAYVNKQKARSLSKLIDGGREVAAVSIRGTAAGKRCDQVAILAADPAVIRHLLSPRPAGAPTPAHLR